MSEVILASQSPRRRDLLTRMGVDYEVIPSHFVEKLDSNRPPEDVARELALGKALTVARLHPNSIVIGSDSIVTVDGTQLEKPHDEDDALRMLTMLSGKRNDVSTGLAVVRISDGTQLVGAETTQVFFRPYDDEAMRRYVSSGDPLDKAGGYGIQSGAAPLVSHIIGNYDTTIGLPTHLLAEFLAQVGIEATALDLKPPVPKL